MKIAVRQIDVFLMRSVNFIAKIIVNRNQFFLLMSKFPIKRTDRYRQAAHDRYNRRKRR